MNCKNCNDPLEENALFCDNCGAKVIKQRITLTFLLAELFAVMGLESLYLNTLKKMLTAPQEVLNEYLTGVRKRYVNPFAFLAVGAALSLITFNFFSDEFKNMQSNADTDEITEMKALVKKDLSSIKNISEEELAVLKKKQASAKKMLKFQKEYFNFFLQYFNLITFLFLPFYALVSKWTYRKPNNYGEHIVMNAYLQGFTMYISVITFFIAMFTHPLVYIGSSLLYIVYYLFAFGKLYNHSFGKSILKFFRFLIMLVLAIILFLIVIAILLVIVFFIINWLNPEFIKSIFSPV
jgi:hypothetical protein